MPPLYDQAFKRCSARPCSQACVQIHGLPASDSSAPGQLWPRPTRLMPSEAVGSMFNASGLLLRIQVREQRHAAKDLGSLRLQAFLESKVKRSQTFETPTHGWVGKQARGLRSCNELHALQVLTRSVGVLEASSFCRFGGTSALSCWRMSALLRARAMTAVCVLTSKSRHQDLLSNLLPAAPWRFSACRTGLRSRRRRHPDCDKTISVV